MHVQNPVARVTQETLYLFKLLNLFKSFQNARLETRFLGIRPNQGFQEDPFVYQRTQAEVEIMYLQFACIRILYVRNSSTKNFNYLQYKLLANKHMRVFIKKKIVYNVGSFFSLSIFSFRLVFASYSAISILNIPQ